jgi:hypothetical protein
MTQPHSIQHRMLTKRCHLKEIYFTNMTMDVYVQNLTFPNAIFYQFI